MHNIKFIILDDRELGQRFFLVIVFAVESSEIPVMQMNNQFLVCLAKHNF